MAQEKRKRTNWRRLAQRRYWQATFLFILFMGISIMFGAMIYIYEFSPPIQTEIEEDVTRTYECHCLHWGCYCCRLEPYKTIVYNLDINISNIAYTECKKIEQLPGTALNKNISELKCNELWDYYQNGRRCSGYFPETCVYPEIAGGWQNKDKRQVVLLREMLRKNCQI